jgi:hypothetical protein
MDIFHLLKLTIYWSSDLNISISAGNHVEYSLNFAAFNATHFWYIFSCEAASLPLAQISMPHRMILARDLLLVAICIFVQYSTTSTSLNYHVSLALFFRAAKLAPANTHDLMFCTPFVPKSMSLWGWACQTLLSLIRFVENINNIYMSK